ncbi:hypothetical protein QA649_37040 [Bradyrhizobium sp. CB1717]|uniref:hypothetical protein n=1 Tax=Bradyrhizobium sp. CB1717 TaxID=3039154 RepID=UPI0024B1D362|nr:hypothetical protein [Bradyrhizobium sp. CB1717]WFU23568.1 hypothetical protein QA649_37040 [Bradyrhizobium sp. CB1717]
MGTFAGGGRSNKPNFNPQGSLGARQIPTFTIRPASWLAPDVFYVGTDDERGVLLRLDGDVWRACSSAVQVFEGGISVAGKNVDLIEAAERAIALGLDSLLLKQLEEQRIEAKVRAADRWTHLIKRGALGDGPCGTESSGEWFLVELAGTRLECGKPALELLDGFSASEIESIRDAMRVLGPDGWYWPVVHRTPATSSIRS